MPIGTVTAKGQITIPKEIRDQLGLKPGDRVSFAQDSPGQVSLKPVESDFLKMQGILKSKRKKPLSVEEMNRVIAKGYAGLL
jgi:AbrB family looped-hinge helix DNA binding protein